LIVITRKNSEIIFFNHSLSLPSILPKSKKSNRQDSQPYLIHHLTYYF
jgi:hypothetical protein